MNEADWVGRIKLGLICVWLLFGIYLIGTTIFTGPTERVNLHRIELRGGFVDAYWIMNDGRTACATFNLINVYVGPETRLIIEHESGFLFIPGSNLPISLELTRADMATMLSNGTVFV